MRYSALDAPDPPVEKVNREIPGMRLDILREGNGNGACFSGIGQNPHRLGEGCEELFWTLDAIEKTTDRSKSIIDADVG
jgi:hypothetical protein